MVVFASVTCCYVWGGSPGNRIDQRLLEPLPVDLLVFDRRYPAFWFFAVHLAKGLEFCIRLSSVSCVPANTLSRVVEAGKVQPRAASLGTNPAI
jgi:hypothetical protein